MPSAAYDAENRLISIDNGNTSTFVYDGEGHRFSKTNSSAINSGGSTPDPAGTTAFIYDPQGHLVHTEAPSSGSGGAGTGWRGEVYAGSRHLATYAGNLNIAHADWIGTERNRDSPDSNAPQYPANQNITGLPFGDWIDNSLGLSPEETPLNFTGQYHDFESDLDYFGARYYSSTQGRFTSPDPLLSSGRLANPQTWNRYAYALNNPLRIVDPTGLYDWDQSAGGAMSDEELQGIADDRHNKRHKWAQQALKFRDQFRNALDSADEAAGNSALSEDQQAAAQAAVNAYGSEGDNNGVTVGSREGHGATTLLNNNDTISVSFGSSVKGDFLAATVAHEGAHVDQAQTWLRGGESSTGDLNHYAREEAAWAVGSSIAQALGMKSLAPYGGGRDLQVWNKGWAQADIETLRARGIQNVLNLMRNQSSDADLRKTFSEEHHQ